MAEIVQKNCESMIRELECLRQTKLFSEDEIRRILKQRRHLESKVNNMSKNIADYKTYIVQETLILKKIRERRREHKISAKKGWIDNRIILRIRRLYQTALQRFYSDYSLHVDAYKFCRKHNYSATTTQIVDSMIKMFSGKPEVWILASGWYRQSGDIMKTRRTLQKGLTFNPQSIHLYNTAIKLEIDEASRTKSDTEEIYDNKCVENIKIYVSLLLKNVTKLEDILSTLRLLENHEFLNSAESMILTYLSQNHAKDELVWNKSAKREENVEIWKIKLDHAINLNENDVNTIFEQGVSVLKERALPLWMSYLKFLVFGEKNDDVRKCFEDGVKQPIEICNVLKPKYIEWIALNDGMPAARAKYRNWSKL